MLTIGGGGSSTFAGSFGETRRSLGGGGLGPPELSPAERGLFTLAQRAVPPPLTWPDPPDEIDEILREQVAPVWHLFAGVVGRYLTARAFASWVAYQGTGLRVVVRAVEAALAVLRIEAARQTARTDRVLDADALKEAIRSSDLLLVHYADPQALADALVAYCALPSISS